MKTQHLQQTLLSLLSLLCLSPSANANASNNSIYPSPQICELSDSHTPIGQINYIKLKAGDTIITNHTPLDEENIGSLVDLKPAEGLTLPQVEGAYAIFITDNALQVYSYDEAGRYYAKQSISQILEGHQDEEKKNALRDPYPDSFNEALARQEKLPLGRIIDWPDLAQRGLIEDISSENSSNWSHEERLEQIRFLGRNKLNRYIIIDQAPPYSAEKEEKIKQLHQLAQDKHVRIIHGLKNAPTKTLSAQLEQLHQLGLLHFGLEIDLAASPQTTAEEISKQCNELANDFFEQHPEIAPLQLIIKAESTSSIAPSWLQELQHQLHTSIDIIWAVPHNLTQEEQTQLAKALGRAPIIMWTPQEAQAEKQAIPEGKVQQEAAKNGDIAGLITPQMRHGDSKDIRLFTLADYSWNIQDYKAQQSREEADQRLEPSEQNTNNTTTSPQ